MTTAAMRDVGATRGKDAESLHLDAPKIALGAAQSSSTAAGMLDATEANKRSQNHPTDRSVERQDRRTAWMKSSPGTEMNQLWQALV